MPVVNIVKGFLFQHEDGYKEEIPPGAYDMDDKLANHFMVKAHSDNPDPPRLQPGMPQYAASFARYDADQRAAANAENQAVDEAATNTRSEFRKMNQQVRRQRPNQRRTLDEEKQAQDEGQNQDAQNQRARLDDGQPQEGQPPGDGGSQMGEQHQG